MIFDFQKNYDHDSYRRATHSMTRYLESVTKDIACSNRDLFTLSDLKEFFVNPSDPEPECQNPFGIEESKVPGDWYKIIPKKDCTQGLRSQLYAYLHTETRVSMFKKPTIIHALQKKHFSMVDIKASGLPIDLLETLTGSKYVQAFQEKLFNLTDLKGLKDRYIIENLVHPELMQALREKFITVADFTYLDSPQFIDNAVPRRLLVNAMIQPEVIQALREQHYGQLKSCI